MFSIVVKDSHGEWCESCSSKEQAEALAKIMQERPEVKGVKVINWSKSHK